MLWAPEDMTGARPSSRALSSTGNTKSVVVFRIIAVFDKHINYVDCHRAFHLLPPISQLLYIIQSTVVDNFQAINLSSHSFESIRLEQLMSPPSLYSDPVREERITVCVCICHVSHKNLVNIREISYMISLTASQTFALL